MLCISQPDLIPRSMRSISKPARTLSRPSTFNSTSISMADYELEPHAYELNLAGAKAAKRAVELVTAKEPSPNCFVAGAIGPTNRTARFPRTCKARRPAP